MKNNSFAKKKRRKKNQELSWKIIFLTGFFSGILLPNIIWKTKWEQDTFHSIYFIKTFISKSGSSMEIFQEVVQQRGIFWIFAGLCGFSVFGVLVAVLSLWYLGFEMGSMLTGGILQMGFAGGIVGASFLFPQYFFYVPALAGGMSAVYEKSMAIWKNQKTFQGTDTYLKKMLMFGMLYLTGMFLEGFVNPICMKFFTKILDIF